LGQIRKLLFGDHDPYANAKVHPYNAFAWQDSSAAEGFKQILDETKPSLIIEVGTWIGGSAIMMADAAKELNLNVEIVCIDTWLGSVEHWGGVCVLAYENGRPIIYEEFLSNVVCKGYQDVITPFPIDSTNGLLYFKKHNVKADLIYVDGGHDYQSVKNDLYNASEILNYGRWLLGDDYHHPDVRRAAKDVFGEFYLHDKGNKFIWIK
jgi:hypothetical protein